MDNYRLLILMFVFLSEAALGNQSAYVIPLKSLRISKGQLQFTYERPCGAQYLGILISSPGKQSRTELGAVVRRSNMICAKISRIETKQLSFIKARSRQVLKHYINKKPRSIPRGQIQLIPPKDIRLLAHPKKQIQVVYQPRGGKRLGLLLQETEHKNLRIAVLEKPGNKKGLLKAIHKHYPPEIVSVPAYALNPKQELFPMSRKVKNLAKNYRLKLAPIDRKSFKLFKNRGFKLTYKRRCNEAPIGIVAKGYSGQRALRKIQFSKRKEKQEIAIGVLVAHFYNFPCKGHISNKGSKALITTTVKNRDFLIPKGPIKLSFLSPKTKSMRNLKIKSPTQYAMIQDDRSNLVGIRVDSIGGCNSELGAVFTRDITGNLAVGVLETTRKRTCQREAKEISLIEPLTLAKHAHKSIYPLRIK